jgi:hypothetical protein
MEYENIKDTNDIQEQIQSLDDYYCDDYDDYDDYDYYDNNAQDLITCGNCGNVWDGYAQCNCWQLNYDDQEQLLEKAVPKQLLENSETTLDTTTIKS